MVDELVSFRTAKLAKEKGFNEKCKYLYEYDEGGWSQVDTLYQLYKSKNKNIELDPIIPECSAPTQTTLQKWLREEHKIRVYPTHGVSGNFNFEIYVWDKPNNIGKWTRKGNISSSSSFEEALEKGLEAGLKLIKL